MHRMEFIKMKVTGEAASKQRAAFPYREDMVSIVVVSKASAAVFGLKVNRWMQKSCFFGQRLRATAD